MYYSFNYIASKKINYNWNKHLSYTCMYDIIILRCKCKQIRKCYSVITKFDIFFS